MGPSTRGRRGDHSLELHPQGVLKRVRPLAEALEQPFLLLKDMAALKNMRQPDLILSLKRDLALVSSSACLTDIMLGCLPPFFIFFNNVLISRFCTGHLGGVHD